MKSSFRLTLALALFAAPLFTHAELVGSPSRPNPQATINNINLNNSFTPSGPSGFLPSTIIPNTSPAPSPKQPPDQGAPASAPSSTFVPLAPIPGLTEGVVADSKGLANFLNNLYKYLIGVAAVLAVIMITWGGLEIATQDSVSKQGAGRKKIQDALYGLVLVLSPALVFGIINPSILDLNFAKSLEPLDIHNTKTAQISNQTPAAPKTGCTTTHSGPYLETVVCATQNDATNYTCKNGLSLTVPSCQHTSTNNTTCLDNPQAYCGKSITVDYYAYYHSVLGILGFFQAVIPRDKSQEDAFVSGCSADGGSVEKTITAAGDAIIASRAFLAIDTCPSDSGVVVDHSQGAGVVCFGKELACVKK